MSMSPLMTPRIESSRSKHTQAAACMHRFLSLKPAIGDSRSEQVTAFEIDHSIIRIFVLNTAQDSRPYPPLKMLPRRLSATAYTKSNLSASSKITQDRTKNHLKNLQSGFFAYQGGVIHNSTLPKSRWRLIQDQVITLAKNIQGPVYLDLRKR